MTKIKPFKQDRIEELENELEMIKDELDNNQLEQAELRSRERGLKEALAEVEKELEDLGVEVE